MTENKMVVHINKKVGGLLRVKRELLLISSEKAASFANITPGYLALVEEGRRNIKLTELNKLLEILQMDLEELIDREQMLLEQEICDFFEVLNKDDLHIVTIICTLLINSKNEHENSKEMRLLDCANRINKKIYKQSI